LDVIYALMSEKFGFDCYDGNIEATNLANSDIVVHNAIFIKSRIQLRHKNRTHYYVYGLAKHDEERGEET